MEILIELFHNTLEKGYEINLNNIFLIQYEILYTHIIHFSICVNCFLVPEINDIVKRS